MNRESALEVNDFLSKYPEKEILPTISKSVQSHVEGTLQMLGTAFIAGSLSCKKTTPEFLRADYQKVAEEALELMSDRVEGFAAFCETLDPKFL